MSHLFFLVYREALWWSGVGKIDSDMVKGHRRHWFESELSQSVTGYTVSIYPAVSWGVTFLNQGRVPYFFGYYPKVLKNWDT